MNLIIASVCDSKDGAYEEVLRFIAADPNATPQEKECASNIQQFYLDNQCFPSVELIKKHYPHWCEADIQPSTPETLMHHWREKSQSRNAMKLASMMSELSAELMDGNVSFDDAAKSLDELTSDRGYGVEDPIKIESITDHDLEAEMAREPSGITFGIEELDHICRGIESGSAVVIGGYTGSFKSSFGICMGVQNAIKGISSAFLSLERPAAILKNQALSCFSFMPQYPDSPIGHMEILKRALRPDQLDDLKEIQRIMAEQPGKIEIFGGHDIRPNVATGIVPSMKWLADRGHTYLVIDHAQLVKYYMPGTGDISGVDRFIKETTDEAVRLNSLGYDFRVIFMSQINREAYKKASRRGGQYDLTALAEYNELERTASYIVTLYANEELKAVNELRVQLLKHSYGPTIEEPVAVFVDPSCSVVGGPSAMEVFDASESNVDGLLGDDFQF